MKEKRTMEIWSNIYAISVKYSRVTIFLNIVMYAKQENFGVDMPDSDKIILRL